MTVEEHSVSREANDGSRDNMQNNGYDEQRFESRDERADTNTTFYESDINSLNTSERRKRELRRALRRQEGEDYGEAYQSGSNKDSASRQRKQQNREEWKRRIITTYATNLDMTQAQKRRAKHLFLDVLEIRTFGPYSSEEVALGVLNTVAREDGWHIEDNPQFHELMVECGITSNTDTDKPSMSTMKRLRKLVRERVPSMTA